MRAAWYTRFGAAAEVLEVGECDAPEPAAGEVLVRVEFSGINPVDVKRRLGGRGEMESPRVVPHFDGAGVVESVGAGVDAARVGERVWLFEAQWGSPLGSAAELVALPADRAVPLADGVSAREAACLGIPALTAHRSVYADGPVDGQIVLVTGGAGAVGRYAVQCAALGGARVIATVSSEEKAELARSAGAEATLDYRAEDVPGRIAELTDGAGVDKIVEVEFGGNLEAVLAVIKVGGVVATYASEGEPSPRLPFYSFLYKSIVVRHVLVFQAPEEAKRHAVADLTRWMGAGQLSHPAVEVFPLDEVVAAHEAVESGSSGKVVLEIPPAS